MDFFAYFLAAFAVYVCVAFIKFMLCMHNLPVLVACMQRQRQGTPLPSAVLALSAIIVLAFTSFFRWPTLLRSEGLGFFGFYTDRTVMRDCINAYRQINDE